MMTQAEVEVVMRTVFDECQKLRGAGQAEYARTAENALANFERVAQHLGISREQVLFVYMFKHIDGITSFINGHRSQREDVRGRINDVIVYMILLRAMIEDKDRTENLVRMDPMNKPRPVVTEWPVDPALRKVETVFHDDDGEDRNEARGRAP